MGLETRSEAVGDVYEVQNIHWKKCSFFHVPRACGRGLWPPASAGGQCPCLSFLLGPASTCGLTDGGPSGLCLNMSERRELGTSEAACIGC